MIRVRFAPSPTGYLHVGGLRTALYNYLFAKQQKGVFIVRIEDTDRTRSIPGATEKLLLTLKRVGLLWDEGPLLNDQGQLSQERGKKGPYEQSKRLALYESHAAQLVASGKAYYCFCTKERLQKLREDQSKNHVPTRYDGRCRTLSAEEIQKNRTHNIPAVIRLAVPSQGTIHFHDHVRGDVSIEANTIDDQVLLKSDGYPTYHLANVVDDHAMEITHVIRAEEWLPSTPKHLLLYQAFGWNPPEFAHLPLLLNADRSKLSKRQGDVAVEDYLAGGYLPEALVNFIALLGWNPGGEKELFTLQELIDAFHFSHVHKAGAVFDLQKLDWLNSEYIRNMSDKDYVTSCLPYLKTAGAISDTTPERLIAAAVITARPRLKKLSDIVSHTSFFFETALTYKPSLLSWKGMGESAVRAALTNAHTLLESLQETEYTASNLEQKLKSLISSLKIKNGELLWPLRVALTGREASPGPFEVATVLGKEKTLARIQHALSLLKD